MQLPDFHRITNISPGWWSAVAGAATAGAVLVPDHRITAGAVLGSVLLVVALYKAPCCSACAGKPAAPTATAGTQPVSLPTRIAQRMATPTAQRDPANLLKTARIAAGGDSCS